MGWFASSLYSITLGRLYTPEPEATPTSFISLEYLDRQADQLFKWAVKTEKFLFSEQKLKKVLRDTTEHSEADIQLLFNHLKMSGRMQTISVGSSADYQLCKL